MIRIKVNDLNLKDTITCGQIFRFKEDKGSYIVILSDRVVRLKCDDNYLYVSSNNEENLEEVIRYYLDLDRDYNSINDSILKNNSDLNEIILSSKGLKMIQQNPFECLISYIISANNRVDMISKVVDNISAYYGKKVVFEGSDYYLFPTIDEIKNCDKETLRSLKTGFRDEYIYEIINKIVNKEFDLEIIKQLNTIDALDYLCTNKGIGEKVASCILLFSYSRFDVFPIDTWVKKFMKEKYNIEGINNIKEYSKKYYKENSGLIIQYIFNYSRNKKSID